MHCWEGVVIDKDGTLLRGTAPIHGATAFVSELVACAVPFVILSNTGVATATTVARTLSDALGVAIDAECVITSHDVMRARIDDRAYTNVFVVGACTRWPALDLRATVPDDCRGVCVALFFDGHVPQYYEHMVAVAAWVRRGATLCCTAQDATIMSEKAVLPGPGIFVDAVLQLAGPDSRCEYFGKGSTSEIGAEVTARLMRQGFVGQPWKILMVGDRVDTDITVANANQWSSCLVESGCHRASDRTSCNVSLSTVAGSVHDLIGQRNIHFLDLVKLVLGKTCRSLRTSLPPRRIRSCPSRLDDLGAVPGTSS